LPRHLRPCPATGRKKFDIILRFSRRRQYESDARSNNSLTGLLRGSRMRASSDGGCVHDRLSPATASSERPGAICSLPLRFLERSVRVWEESVLAFFKRWPWWGSFRCRGPDCAFAAPDVILRRRRRSSAVHFAIERPDAAHSRSKS
jgi:hypothetical protein